MSLIFCSRVKNSMNTLIDMNYFPEFIAISIKAKESVVGKDESKGNEAKCETVCSTPLDVRYARLRAIWVDASYDLLEGVQPVYFVVVSICLRIDGGRGALTLDLWQTTNPGTSW